jgi:hypothetical protein
MRQGELFGAALGDLDFLRKIMHVDVQVKYVAGCLLPDDDDRAREIMNAFFAPAWEGADYAPLP